VEVKLLVNRYDKRLNVPGREKRTNQRWGSCCWSGAEVCRLANLAGGLILPLGVGVGQNLGGEENEQDRQGKCQHPDPVRPRLVLASHLYSQTTPTLALTPGLFRSEHPGVLRNIPRWGRLITVLRDSIMGPRGREGDGTYHPGQSETPKPRQENKGPDPRD
jgi:hypothetical protein